MATIRSRRPELVDFIMKVLSEFSTHDENGEEIYFTFVKNEGRIIANVCKENTEIESFILTIEPSDKRFIFKKTTE